MTTAVPLFLQRHLSDPQEPRSPQFPMPGQSKHLVLIPPVSFMVRDGKVQWGGWDKRPQDTELTLFTPLFCSLSLSLTHCVWLWSNRMAGTSRQGRGVLQSSGTLCMASITSRTRPVFSKNATPCHIRHWLLFSPKAEWLRGPADGAELRKWLHSTIYQSRH